MGEKIRWWAKFIVGNWKTIITMLTVVSGFSGFRFYELAEKDNVITASNKQIAEIARQYHHEYTPQPITIKNNCNCKRLIQKHIRKYHQ